MNLRDKFENGSILSEEYVLPTIIRLGIIRQIPILVFINMSSVQFLNKLIPIYSQIDKDKLKENRLSPEEWNLLDQKMSELYNAPLWLNDIEVNSVDDYKSAEEVIAKEKIKYVFIDSLPEAINKSEIIKWSEEVGFNVYFTNFTLEYNYTIMDNIQNLIKKAEAGDVKAQFDLALAYSKGYGIECNYEKAYNLWIELAEKKVPAAMFNLGRMFLYGLGREVDIANAMHWFWKAHRHKNNCLNVINHVRLYFANDYLSTKPRTISNIHIKEIAEYKKQKDAIIDCYIENCQKQEVNHPYKFDDLDYRSLNRIFYLNVYPYPTSVSQNGFKEYLCSILLQRRALELSDIDFDRANAYLDTSYEVIKNIPDTWVADSYMDYCELKGKFYMKQENWEEAIITFTDILKYRYSCDLSQFPKDDENIKEKLSEDELEHLKKAEYSFYDAYVSLIECYFKQNMIHDAEDSSCDLYKLLNERTDSWAIDWVLGEIEKETINSKQPNLIYILKKLGTQHISWYCNALYRAIIKMGIYKKYNWSKKQCELIEAMFKLAIPYFEQKMEDYENKLTLTKLNLYKGEYLMQKKQFEDAKKMFLNALSFSNQLLLSDEVSNILGILEIRLYQVLNRNKDKQYYKWGFIFFMNRRLLSGKIYGQKKFFEPILTSSN